MSVGATAERYRTFARLEAYPESSSYQKIAEGVATDPDLLAFLTGLPYQRRQPNLFFAAVRYLGGPTETFAAFRAFALDHLADLTEVMLTRSTQTNEAARAAVLLPVLALLPQPLALLEVGASAGLCLLPDRYRYDYSGRRLGPPDSPVELRCEPRGPAPVPDRVPEVVWRAGIDLNPLDVRDTDDMRWLEALIWPEQDDRLAVLRAAAEVARADPPTVVRGDLNTTLSDLAAAAPAGATLVVFHSAVLPYLLPAQRSAFAELVGRLRCRWVSNESPKLLPRIASAVAGALPTGRAVFAVGLDGTTPVALAAPHGQWLAWL